MKNLKFILGLLLLFPFSLSAAQLAQTPPMGWNSWNAFGMGINEKVIKQTADFMVSSGFRDAGYAYCNLDYGWQVSRDPKGEIQADPKQFPSGMKALGDYLHSKGLKFGIYTCAGTETCGKRPGSKGHEVQDMKTYASWGVDYIKVDWCSTDGLKSQAQYALFRDGIQQSGRPMVLSLCNWGVDQPWLWGKQFGQLWRTTGDLVSCWDCKKDWGGMGVVQVLDKMEGLDKYSGPGGWNDPDMLQVGNGDMTLGEDRAHFSLWCVMAAPLMAGTNLATLKPAVKEVLLNTEAVALDQDPLGQAGKRIKTNGKGQDVWARPLADGSWAVCLLNRGAKSADVQVSWKDLGWKEDQMKVRDLWSHRDLGVFDGGYNASVASHDVVFLKVGDAKAPALKASALWRIRPGGDPLKDKQGHEWMGDMAFKGGQTAQTVMDVKAKGDMRLYQSERWGENFNYSLPVEPGQYQVKMRFCELYVKNPGERVFNVLINGQKALERFDILKEAGGFAKGIEKTIDGVEPDDKGMVNIHFITEVQMAKVCSIEIVRQK